MKFKIPFLHNVRRGLATNSSSSHSLVFHADRVDDGTGDPVSDALTTDVEFGWEHFVLSRLGEKLMYGLVNMVGQGWRDSFPTYGEIARIKQDYAHLFPEFAERTDVWYRAVGGYVDHQSRIYGTDSDLIAKLRDPHVVVHGGNDNGGYPDIDYEWDGEKSIETDNDLPAGARREMLG